MADTPSSDPTDSLCGFPLVHRGKVRNTYQISDELRLVEATNQASIFDFRLGTPIPKKGEVLTAANHHSRRRVMGDLFPHDLVVAGGYVVGCIPDLRGEHDLLKRVTIVRCMTMIPVEAVVRHGLTGTGWEAYERDGTVCGHRLPPGLRNGDILPYPIFAPTTKAEQGHDAHLNVNAVAQEHGFQIERLALQLFEVERVQAEERGLVLVDTKYEFGYDADGVLTVCDEVHTPDSTRFWHTTEWEACRGTGTIPKSRDKQRLREWGIKVGINKLDPTNPEHIARVYQMPVPEEIVEMITQTYLDVFEKRVGMSLDRYQREEMGIAA